MNATPGTDVTLMAKTEGAQRAYGVKCPKCKAKPGMFCTYLRPDVIGPYTPPDPKWGTPCKRPHNERFDAVWRDERRLAYEAHVAERAFDPMAAERQALAQQAIREYVDLRDWLRVCGSLLCNPLEWK